MSQLKIAQKWLNPLDLSHFDSHMGSFYGIQTIRLEMLAHVFSIAYETGLPFRIPLLSSFKPVLLEFRKLGFPILDDLITVK
jgi:chitin disaccharide deacetylase